MILLDCGKREDIVEEPTLSKMEEEATDSLCAAAVGAPAAFGRFVPTNHKNNLRYACILVETSSQEGAV
jgi:hypothetical protein